jgi:hypothetical protein
MIEPDIPFFVAATTLSKRGEEMRKVLLTLVGASALCLVIGGTSFAFHDHGVADCGGCHTMHNSQNGELVDPDSPGGNDWLLVDSTPSDVCLSCHATRLGAVFGADPTAPPAERGAGNFTFLLEDNLNDGHAGATNPIPGDAGGHNIKAPSKGVGADAILTTSPGGSFPSSELGCSSCHDPHGNAGFRMLNGTGDVQDGLFLFNNAAPVAEGVGINGAGEALDFHTAYQSGWSAWCGNCHGDFHNSVGVTRHPTDEAIGGSIATAYNLYNGTDDITGGAAGTAYLPQVPFEDTAVTNASTAGPSGTTSKVMCMTCHRAHATSAPDAGRWDFNVTFLEEDGVESGSYALPDPYGSANQRSLCNKCHVKDEGDAPF